MNQLLRAVAKWRSWALTQTYFSREGETILQGPFAGMVYAHEATEGALLPRLLGTYESELHPHLDAFIAEGVDCVIDVGCAEGYYAVGLARRIPSATVYAHDISEAARAACAELAQKNGVAERVVIGGEFRPEHFQDFAGRRALVMVDTEGAELDILVPERAAALAEMRIIVETHDMHRPGALKTLMSRFAPTHDIQRVDQGPKTLPMPWWIQELGHLDHLLAVWEFRSAPTPWLVMRPKAA
jgi:precorrin-6B methylase 2